MLHSRCIGYGDGARGIEVRHVNKNPAFEAAVFVEGEVVVVDVGAGQIECEPELAINSLMRAVHASLHTAQTIGDDDAALIEIVDGGAILGVGRSTGEREVLIDRGPAVHQLVFPIRIGAPFTSECGAGENSSRNLRLNEVAVLRAGEEVETGRVRRHAGRDVVLDARSAGAALLGLNENDTV